METYKFDCGCEFPILDPTLKEDGLPSLDLDYDKISLNCPKTWSLFLEGRTKGVFQLEKSLGQHWSKLVEPTSIEQVSDLISILRPGCIAGCTPVVVQIYKSPGRRHFRTTKIETIFKNFRLYKNIISYDEASGQFVQNKIENIVYNGKKPVYEIFFKKIRNTKPQKSKLVCTDDHKLLTLEGWKELKDFKVGERFAIIKYTSNRECPKLEEGERYFPNICFKHFEYKCVFCDWKEASLDTNHIEGNRKTNNHFDNLVFLCPNHHRMYTEKKISKEEIVFAREKYRLPIMEDVEWAYFIEKKYKEDTDIYDITMANPHHNFIAGGTVVHNCLSFKDESGKSMAQHYVDRKNGSEDAVPLDPTLYDILEDTQQVMLYQESILKIAEVIAGYDLREADSLRKAIGKKQADLMAKNRIQFIEKAKEKGVVTEEMAGLIFDNIEKSARYSFNRCLGLDTLVERNNELVSIEEIKVGDFIESPDGLIEVVDIHNNGIKELVEVTLESGKQIKCTLDHKFLCEDNIVRPLYEIISENYKIMCENE